MAFDYLERTKPRPDGEARRVHVHTTELAQRAALLYRLGFTVEAATARLAARTAWEFDPPSHGKHGVHHRPAALSDQAIAKIVADTFARRPG
jgi:hypothetical protein